VKTYTACKSRADMIRTTQQPHPQIVELKRLNKSIVESSKSLMQNLQRTLLEIEVEIP